jgi:hypothetical protein
VLRNSIGQADFAELVYFFIYSWSARMTADKSARMTAGRLSKNIGGQGGLQMKITQITHSQ